MKIRNILSTLAFLVAISFTSCDELLTIKYDNTFDSSRLPGDPVFAEGLMIKAYQSLPGEYNSNNTGYFTEVVTDDAVTNEVTSAYPAMASGAWSSRSNLVSEWDSYGVIRYINQYLEAMPTIRYAYIEPDVDYKDRLFRNQFKGECYGLRAYYHSLILKAHGGMVGGVLMGVPYLKETPDALNPDTWRLQRPTYEQTMNELLADLDTAIKYLPEKYENKTGDDNYNVVAGATQLNRISKVAAMALKARITLNYASPAYHNGSYDLELCKKAAQYAAWVIDKTGGVNIVPVADCIFWDADADANNTYSTATKNFETIWRTNKATTSLKEAMCYPPSLGGKGNINPSLDFVLSFGKSNGVPLTDTEKLDANITFTGRDPRLAKHVVCNGTKVGGSSQGILTYTGGDDGIGSQTFSTRTGFYLKKWLRDDVTKSMTAKLKTVPIIRQTEMLLIYAEAASMFDGAAGKTTIGASGSAVTYSAFDVIKRIRVRAGITTGATDAYLATFTAAPAGSVDFMKLIRNERRIELSFEGFRFWDLRRWNLDPGEINKPVKGFISDALGNRSFIVEERNYGSNPNTLYYGPVPNNEILKSDGALKQNDGWN